MAEVTARKPERLLFVLGQSATADETARRAVSLAAKLSVELCALFIEDEAVLQVSSLPRSTRVVWGKMLSEPVARESVEQEWRALSGAARASVEREAKAQHVRCEFRIARGVRAAELLRALSPTDLLLFASDRRTQELRAARSSVPSAARVYVIHEGTEVGERALVVARAIAGMGVPIEVWLCSAGAESGRALEARLRGMLGASASIKRFTPQGLDSEPRALLAAATGGVLVLPADWELGRRMAERAQMPPLPCWVVLTR